MMMYHDNPNRSMLDDSHDLHTWLCSHLFRVDARGRLMQGDHGVILSAAAPATQYTAAAYSRGDMLSAEDQLLAARMFAWTRR